MKYCNKKKEKFPVRKRKVLQLGKEKFRNGKSTRSQKTKQMVEYRETKLGVKNVENPNLPS